MRNEEDDLRALFRALSSEDAASAPNIAPEQIDAWRAALRYERARRGRHVPRTLVAVGASVVGAVVALSIGLVWGANTGYASARAELQRDATQTGEVSSPLQPTGSSAMPIKRAIAITCGALALGAPAASAPAQQGVPVVDLPPASAKTTEWFRAILGMRQVANGNVLVNDAGRRSVKLLDSTLVLQAVARDSMPGLANSYGPRPSPLIRYLGDSSLMVDRDAGVLLVVGPTGQVARSMAPTSQDMMMGLGNAFGGVDAKGRLVHEARIFQPSGLPVGTALDSTLVVRSDFETRRLDTLARVKSLSSTHLMGKAEGSTAFRYSVEPAPVLDAWALLSDGSIAVVRGQDYHIDWIYADGTTHSTAKLPFDWKRLTDQDKQRLIDSTREATAPGLARAMAPTSPKAAAMADSARGGGGGGDKPGGRGYSPSAPDPNATPAVVEYIPPALKDMPDYYPPIRRGSAIPDRDGNLWILPTSSAQSKQGELVYDVVNAKGDFHRVRIPVGRSIAGFGKDGVVFLLSGDRTNGFYLEKTKLPPQNKTASR